MIITPGRSPTKRSVGLAKRFFLTNSWRVTGALQKQKNKYLTVNIVRRPSQPSQLSYPIKGFLPWPTSKIITVKINVQCLDVNKNDPK